MCFTGWFNRSALISYIITQLYLYGITHLMDILQLHLRIHILFLFRPLNTFRFIKTYTFIILFLLFLTAFAGWLRPLLLLSQLLHVRCGDGDVLGLRTLRHHHRLTLRYTLFQTRLTKPVPRGNALERGLETVGMVALVAAIAKQQVVLVAWLLADLTVG